MNQWATLGIIDSYYCSMNVAEDLEHQGFIEPKGEGCVAAVFNWMLASPVYHNHASSLALKHNSAFSRCMADYRFWHEGSNHSQSYDYNEFYLMLSPDIHILL
jgi:hypothetical protein